jgi:hypothetical protein
MTRDSLVILAPLSSPACFLSLYRPVLCSRQSFRIKSDLLRNILQSTGGEEAVTLLQL